LPAWLSSIWVSSAPLRMISLTWGRKGGPQVVQRHCVHEGPAYRSWLGCSWWDLHEMCMWASDSLRSALQPWCSADHP
jgi:hypothetical protein